MKLPRIVSQMVSAGALIVGGVGRAIATGDTDYIENLKDYDLMVPTLDQWYEVALLIPKEAKVNSFGGWKFIEKGVEVDVWVESLDHYLKYGKMRMDGEVYAVDYINNTTYQSHVEVGLS